MKNGQVSKMSEKSDREMMLPEEMAAVARDDTGEMARYRLERLGALENRSPADVVLLARGFLTACKMGQDGGKLEGFLSLVEAEGYAYGMHNLYPAMRMRAWAVLQKSARNLFAVHPYIEKLMQDENRDWK